MNIELLNRAIELKQRIINLNALDLLLSDEDPNSRKLSKIRKEASKQESKMAHQIFEFIENEQKTVDPKLSHLDPVLVDTWKKYALLKKATVTAENYKQFIEEYLAEVEE